jgi:hypothetical protein
MLAGLTVNEVTGNPVCASIGPLTIAPNSSKNSTPRIKSIGFSRRYSREIVASLTL